MCIREHEAAQVARLDQRFSTARASLNVCAQSVCPAALREDCAGWLREVELESPSIVLVVEAEGRELEEARLLIDGALVASGLDGRQVLLDPGPHLLRLELPSGEFTERRIFLSDGERGGQIHLTFESSPLRPPVEPNTGSSDSEPDLLPRKEPVGEVLRPVRWPTYALSGLALLSGGVGLGVGAKALSYSREAERVCAPTCDPEISQSVNRRALVADVALGVSAVSVLGAVLTYAYRPSLSVDQDPRRVSLGVRGVRRGGVLGLTGVF